MVKKTNQKAACFAVFLCKYVFWLDHLAIVACFHIVKVNIPQANEWNITIQYWCIVLAASHFSLTESCRELHSKPKTTEDDKLHVFLPSLPQSLVRSRKEVNHLSNLMAHPQPEPTHLTESPAVSLGFHDYLCQRIHMAYRGRIKHPKKCVFSVLWH